MERLKAALIDQGAKFFIVASRFNEFITNWLIEGCIDELKRLGVKEENISLAWVPGAFEMPLVAKLAVEKGYSAVICLAAIIRGETPHFDFVANEVAKGIANVSLETKTPVIYGVITADAVEQAIDRAGTKAGNRGRDAARSAVEMVNLLKQLK